VKLRIYLFIASSVSTGIILISLFICYRYMLLKWKELVLLIVVTVAAALVSMIVHYFMTRPLEKAIHTITEETCQIAEGNFEGKVRVIGPSEFQMLANQFNLMSGRLNESFQLIRTAEASRRELVANVSHDLRTPMASIKAFVEALQDDIIKDEEIFQRYLLTIQLETGRLNGLIEQLFRLSQLESGVAAFEPEPYHVDHLILDGLQGLAIHLEEKKLHVEVAVPDKIQPVAIVPSEMNRVLTNLLQNAIRYSPKEGTIHITVVQQSDGLVTISVSDQGEGIKESDQSRIFERFYRADPSRNRDSGGAGLGLAIAKSIVELHGGAIGVKSKPTEGSVFWFTIPTYKEKPLAGA
jgi:signal transduction histidine kinase